MLKKITRDETKPPKVPHQNKVKNTKHHYQLGCLDFPGDRTTSTKNYFHDSKQPVPNEVGVPRASLTHIQISHGHSNLGLEASMTRHDFAPYVFSSTPPNPDDRSKVSYRSGLSLPKQTGVVYPSTKKLSNSLSGRDPTEVLVADRSEPFMSKKDLLKSKFELSLEKDFRKKSHYGETFMDASAAKQNLPDIRFKSSTRNFDIITGTDKPSFAHSLNYYRYEFYNPDVGQSRVSSNQTNLPVVLNRIDPITGRPLRAR